MHADDQLCVTYVVVGCHAVCGPQVAAEDIRLNMVLYKACATDWKKFCKDVEPGHMRVQVRVGGQHGLHGVCIACLASDMHEGAGARGNTGDMVSVACLATGVHGGAGVHVWGCNTGDMCLSKSCIAAWW